MRQLSATECITPAMERTKHVLFSPFRMGRTWKLSATGYLTCAATIFFPFPLVYLMFAPAAKQYGGWWAVALLVTAALLGTGLAVVLFYLCTRLQFAYFDIVINRGEFVAPAWRKYGPASLRWTGFKLAVGAAVTAVLAVPIAGYVRHMIPLFRTLASEPPGQPPSPEFMKTILAFYAGYGVLMLVSGAFYFLSSLMADFILPSLALENTTLKEAVRRLLELIRMEPGEFFIFTLLKLGLGIAAYMGAIIAWEFVFLLCTVILIVVAVAFGALLHLMGIPSAVLTVVAVIAGIGWYLFGMVYLMMLTIGPVVAFLQAYAAYFLGGRYRMLGDLLDRSTPAPSFPAVYPYGTGYPTAPPPADTVG